MIDKTKTDEVVFTDNCSRLPEAPALAWTKFQSPAGFDWSITLRAGLPTDQTVQALSQMREMIAIFEKGANSLDWQPVVNGHTPVKVKPATSNGNGNATELSFPAETLVGSVTDGKTYWKIKGGNFRQYGVTIWPEVLEAAGINTEELDPTATPLSLEGQTAHYVLNENGKPQKVTRLV